MSETPATSGHTGHCPTCTCGRRAPVQGSREHNKPDGSISWEEHLLAYEVYAARYGSSQSAERIAERGGFSWSELLLFLGCEPKTWKPR